METFNKMTIYSSNWDEILSIVLFLTEVKSFKEDMLKDIMQSEKLYKGIELE